MNIPISNTSTKSSDIEIEVKLGRRVLIDGQWFTITTFKEPNTWELVGYFISTSTGMKVHGMKINIERTTEEIRQFIADYRAERVFMEGFRLPPLKAKKKLYPTRAFFVQRIMALRQSRIERRLSMTLSA
jgi:hypothetical protein